MMETEAGARGEEDLERRVFHILGFTSRCSGYPGTVGVVLKDRDSECMSSKEAASGNI